MYRYLQAEFNKFITNKISEYFSTYEERFYNLDEIEFQEVGFNKEDFITKFILPYKNLTFQKRIKILELVSRLSYTHFNEHCEFKIVKPKYLRKFNACIWTIFHMYIMNKALGLNFDYSNNSIWDIEISEYLDIPYNQCYYCGQPNEDSLGNKFNKKKKYCHTHDCDLANTNEYAHTKECCYRRFRMRQKLFRELLDKISKGKTEKYFKLNSSEKQNLIKKEFINFCEMLYNTNLEIDYTIQLPTKTAEKLS